VVGRQHGSNHCPNTETYRRTSLKTGFFGNYTMGPPMTTAYGQSNASADSRHLSAPEIEVAEITVYGSVSRYGLP